MIKWLTIIILISSPALAQVAAQQQDSQNFIQFRSEQKSVAPARAYVPITTSDCMGSSGLGVQDQFFGFSFSSTTQSRPCNIREDTKIAMYVLEDEELARKIFLQGDYAKAASAKTAPTCAYPTEECKKSKRFK